MIKVLSLVDVYPYAYAADAANISLDYALFRNKEVVLTDGGLRYSSRFDAWMFILRLHSIPQHLPRLRFSPLHVLSFSRKILSVGSAEILG